MSCNVARDVAAEPARMAVQLVIRAEHGRRYAGRVGSGVLRPGDEVVVLPAGERTQIAAVFGPGGDPVDAAPAGCSAAVALVDDVDAARGTWIAEADRPPEPVRDAAARACWLADAPSRPGGTYLLRHGTATVRARLVDGDLALNDLGSIRVRTAVPIAIDPYEQVRSTGAFILVDETTNDTVCAAMVS